MAVELTPQLLRRHVTFGGIGSEALSESDSGSGGGVSGVAEGADCCMRASLIGATGLGGGGVGVSVVERSGCAGTSSTIECLPVVHGGIERNSSKVRTRGLQHFQPIESERQSSLCKVQLQARGHLSAPRERWEVLGDRRSLLQDL